MIFRNKFYGSNISIHSRFYKIHGTVGSESRAITDFFCFSMGLSRYKQASYSMKISCGIMMMKKENFAPYMLFQCETQNFMCEKCEQAGVVLCQVQEKPGLPMPSLPKG